MNFAFQLGSHLQDVASCLCKYSNIQNKTQTQNTWAQSILYKGYSRCIIILILYIRELGCRDVSQLYVIAQLLNNGIEFEPGNWTLDFKHYASLC